ncbi:MAG: YraN family protein [Bacteroidales bacterium]|jgi:putative endonuclease|nr:YraN family protein [Bacteroidales bacterium]
MKNSEKDELKKETGRRGEDEALRLLLLRGQKLLARNWRYGHKEIDIITEDEKFIRFIEVRSLTYPNIVEPYETISEIKKKKIINAAGGFLRKSGLLKGMQKKKEITFDVVSVIFKGSLIKINYIPDAFGPVW